MTVILGNSHCQRLQRAARLQSLRQHDSRKGAHIATFIMANTDKFISNSYSECAGLVYRLGKQQAARHSQGSIQMMATAKNDETNSV